MFLEEYDISLGMINELVNVGNFNISIDLMDMFFNPSKIIKLRRFDLNVAIIFEIIDDLYYG